MDTILQEGERTTYEVRVATGNRLGASTKADIKIVLCGDKGRTEEIFLKDSLTYKVKFQRGQVRHNEAIIWITILMLYLSNSFDDQAW